MFGLYDVHIASATITSGIEAHIDGVDQNIAECLKSFLLNSIKSVPYIGNNNPIPSNQNSASTATVSGQKNVSKINLTEEISSNKYPLTNRWFYSSIISYVIGSIITAFIFASFIVIPFTHKTSEIDPNYSANLSNNYNMLGKIPTVAMWLFIAFVIWGVIRLLLWKRKYKFEFTPEYIFYRTGVIGIQETHLPYNTVQDINVKQGVIDKMFGISKVFIQNAAQNGISRGISVEGITIDNANHIAEILRNILLTKNSQNTGL